MSLGAGAWLPDEAVPSPARTSGGESQAITGSPKTVSKPTTVSAAIALGIAPFAAKTGTGATGAGVPDLRPETGRGMAASIQSPFWRKSMLARPRGRRFRSALGGIFLASAVAAPLIVMGSPARAERKSARYYFHVGEIKAPESVDPALRDETARALREELAERSEWESDLGVGGDRQAEVAALAARKLRGFDVSVKVHEIKRDLNENQPGVGTKRVGVKVRLEVLGLTLPGEKLAFSGDGEASGEIEASERRLEGEARGLEKELLRAAVKQAVDAAMVKLSLPASKPKNEKRGKRK